MPGQCALHGEDAVLAYHDVQSTARDGSPGEMP